MCFLFFSQTCGEWNVYLDLWRETGDHSLKYTDPMFRRFPYLANAAGCHRYYPSLLPGSLCELWRIWGTWPSCRRQESATLALLPMILPGLNVLNLTIHSRCRSDTSLRRRDSPAVKWVLWNAFKVKGSVDRGHLRCFWLNLLSWSMLLLQPSPSILTGCSSLWNAFDVFWWLFQLGRWGEGSWVVRVTTGNKLTWVKACFVLPSGEFRSIFLAPSSDETLRQCGRTSYSRWGWFDMIRLVLRKWPKTNLACHWVNSRTQNGECWNAWLEMIKACVEVAVEERSR